MIDNLDFICIQFRTGFTRLQATPLATTRQVAKATARQAGLSGLIQPFQLVRLWRDERLNTQSVCDGKCFGISSSIQKLKK